MFDTYTLVHTSPHRFKLSEIYSVGTILAFSFFILLDKGAKKFSQKLVAYEEYFDRVDKAMVW